MTKHKVLLIGGSGFLGSHIADRLSAEGHKVVIFDNKSSPHLKADQVLICGELSNRPLLQKALEGCNLIFHLGAATQNRIDEHPSPPYELMKTELLGMINLLEIAKDNKVQRILLASSTHISSRSLGFDNIAKHTCELLLEEYKERFGLNATIIRLGSLVGTRADEQNMVYRLLKAALKEKSVSFHNTSDEVCEFLHVEEAAQICVAALSPEYSNQNLILAGNHRMKSSDLLSMIREIVGHEISIIEHKKDLRTPLTSRSHYSFQPRVGRKIISNPYCDLGQSLLEILEEIDTKRHFPI